MEFQKRNFMTSNLKHLKINSYGKIFNFTPSLSALLKIHEHEQISFNTGDYTDLNS